MVSRISRSALCLALFLAATVAAEDGVVESSSRRHLRKSASKTRGSVTEERRSLKRTLKGQDRDSSDLKRMVIKCPPSMSQENCLEQLSMSGESIKLIHKLPGIHALAVEVDSSTRDDLFRMGLDLKEDPVREALFLEDSIQYHRDLSKGTPYGLDLIGATKVWKEYGVRGEDVKVCVMDTGVDADHPAFGSSKLSGYDETDEFVTPWYEDDKGHGTHISGIIAASENDQGIIGVAPAAELYMIRVFRQNGRFYGSDVVAAAEACREAGAHIISMSLGGDGYDQAEHDIFQDLYLNDGILAVASAGNTGGPEAIYPAAYDNVLSVAACDQKRGLADFSTYNSFVDIAAPGKSVRARPEQIISCLFHSDIPLAVSL
jgi:subtilisin family serine protease